MRAWLLDDTTGPEAYRLGEVPTPEPGTGEVRVALRASALNHLDLWVARGMPAPPSFPHIPGADGAGVIDAVGPGLTRAEIGEEVVIDPSTSCGTCEACARGDIPFCPDFRVVGEHRPGTHAEAILLPEANVARKPARLDWPEAAAFGLVASSAWRMLRRGRVEEGDRILVVGVGGGTSTAAFLLARALGAEVFVTSTAPEKRGWAMEQGASRAFDSTDAYDEEVRAATDGRGVDVVFDNVGTVTFERSLRALARGGRLVTNGSTSGRTAELHLPTLFWRQLEVIGSSMNDHQEFADAVAMVAGGALDIPVDSVFPFEDYPTALARLESGDQLGKLVLAR
jgi:NADPH:quinone reductase-like Zn-dependent oxidoreductase